MIVEESFSIDAGGREFIHIRHVQVWNTGTNMGGPMWFERRNLGWVVATLNASLRIYAYPEAALVRGGDSLKIFESGHEQAPYTNLMNRRASGAPHGGVYALALSRPIAERLGAELAALRER